MGIKSSMPIFISPAAMAKLGHPLGEKNLTRAAGDWDIVQAVSLPVFESLIEDNFNADGNRFPRMQVAVWTKFSKQVARINL